MNHYILFAFVFAWAQIASAILLSSSSLNSCIADGSTSTPSLSCKNEIVVSLAVSASSGFDESMELSLSCVGSSDGSCPCPCNYAIDPTCACRDVQQPIKVSLSKTAVYASYPMQYLQSFNYKPYEAVVRPPSMTCSASGSNPTCGYYFIGPSQVPDSEGFVCECSSSQIWDQTLGSNNDAYRTRANLDCNFFSNPLNNIVGNVPCSASCLMFDPLWYSGYTLGPSSLQFNIDVSVTIPTSSSPSPSSSIPSPVNPSGRRALVLGSSAPLAAAPTLISETLQLNPSVPVAISSSRLVSATLVGDLASYTSAPVLSDQLLLIPEPPGWDMNQILTSNRSTWMVLGYNNIDLTDTQCNKIGSSFSAFKSQPNACLRAPQTCLQGQIKDLEAVDLARIAQGKVPLYLASRFDGNLTASMRSFNGGPLSFALMMASQSKSLVVIKASADNISFVVNSSPGLILGSEVCVFSGATCGGFEAGASQGFLRVNLTNTGSLGASFTLSFSNCSSNIRAVEARQLSISAGQTVSLNPPMSILVEDTNSDLARYCWLTLYDARGYVSDRKMVGFYTNSTVFNIKPTGGLNGVGDGPGSGPKPGYECTDICKKFYDIGCFVSFKCWGKIGGFFGAMIGLALGLAALFLVFLKIGVILAFFSSICSCLGCCIKGSSGRQEARHDDDRRSRSRSRSSSSSRMGREERRKERRESRRTAFHKPQSQPQSRDSPPLFSPFGGTKLTPPSPATLSLSSDSSAHREHINPLYYTSHEERV